MPEATFSSYQVFVMYQTVKTGTLIVAAEIDLPIGGIKTESFCAGWKMVTNVGASGVDKRFSDLGWSCFQKTVPATVNVIGWGKMATLLKAFNRLTRDRTTVKFNCMEITQAVQKTFMGVSFIRLSARARNIKQRLW